MLKSPMAGLRGTTALPRPGRAPALPSFRSISTRPIHQARPTARNTPTAFAAPFVRQKRDLSIPSIPSAGFAARRPLTTVCIRLVLSTVVGLGVVTAAILAHDAFTYSERHVDRVPTNPLSLHPRRGGKKNLPILEVNLDDEEDDEKRKMAGRPRLVIVGGGWGVSRTLITTRRIDRSTGSSSPSESPPLRLQRHPHLPSNILRLHTPTPLRLRRHGGAPVSRRTSAKISRPCTRPLSDGIGCRLGHGGTACRSGGPI